MNFAASRVKTKLYSELFPGVKRLLQMSAVNNIGYAAIKEIMKLCLTWLS